MDYFEIITSKMMEKEMWLKYYARRWIATVVKYSLTVWVQFFTMWLISASAP